MEITNKTLAILLVAAVAISVFGTILSINKINNVQQIRPTTGFATEDTGTATIQINASTSIIFSVDAIDWGSGYVNGSFVGQNCSLYTDSTPNNNGCIGFNAITQGFVLENDGNTNITVQLASNATAAQFIGGSSGGGPLFMYKVADNESGSCVDGAIPSAFTDVNTTAPGTTICPTNSMLFNNSKDSMKIDVYVNIPDNAVSGSKSAKLTATAS